jgi:hypothetical protein
MAEAERVEDLVEQLKASDRTEALGPSVELSGSLMQSRDGGGDLAKFAAIWCS